MAEAAVQLAAHAKVNVLLRVLAREDSGFHSLETLFCLVDLADDLHAERTEGGLELTVQGADLGPPEENLAWKAARMVLDATGNRFGVRLTLTKRIPVAAGLGGGSSDAAAALQATNALANDAVPSHELLQFAARLGSDVVFFLTRAPLALAWGRGERLLRLPPLPAAVGLLLCPPIPVSTAEAYGWLDEVGSMASRRGGLALTLDALSSWGDLARMAGNDFEAAVFRHRPPVRAAFEALTGTRPLLCRMSGSGAALVALYRSAPEREEAVLALGAKHGRALPVSTLVAPPPPARAPGRG